MDNPQYSAKKLAKQAGAGSFKPYYKWITLNTSDNGRGMPIDPYVLNLIING